MRDFVNKAERLLEAPVPYRGPEWGADSAEQALNDAEPAAADKEQLLAALAQENELLEQQLTELTALKSRYVRQQQAAELAAKEEAGEVAAARQEHADSLAKRQAAMAEKTEHSVAAEHSAAVKLKREDSQRRLQERSVERTASEVHKMT